MVTLARTSAKRMPGMAGDLRTRSEAVVVRGAMPRVGVSVAMDTVGEFPRRPLADPPSWMGSLATKAEAIER